MPVTDAFATASEYRAAIKKSDTADDATILLNLSAVTQFLNRELRGPGRHFTKDAGGVARTFEPEGNFIELWVDDLVSVSAVKLDDNDDGTAETTLAATDYVLAPRNAAVGAEPRPYTCIEMRNTGTRLYWPVGRLVEVTGVWGWPAVPEAIKRLCIELTAIWRLESPRAEATVSELGQLVQSSSQARGILDRFGEAYRRRTP